MTTHEALRERIKKLDGRDYGGYQSLQGSWDYPDFELHMARIPKDPYAPPAVGGFRVRVSRDMACFPKRMTATREREIALRDFLARRFLAACNAFCPGRRGTGHGGIITIAEPGQAILERTSVVIDDDNLEARFFLGLPARKRTIRADIAEAMLLEELPRIVKSSFLEEGAEANPDGDPILENHLAVAEDTAFIRDRLADLGWVAFIPDGASLPRSSGISQKPLESQETVPFRSPEGLRVSIVTPNRGEIKGMGIPRGVTLIVGGGYHGKSTLLQALELGIYNHIPGDGREYCAALSETVKVRAMSGRSVSGTDISAFIGVIPQGTPTDRFHTANASGSTSQAAFIAESISAGAKLLVLDEDTCATNFMIRDRRMQQLVAKEDEPITSFVDRVRPLYEMYGISTVLVLGGSGDYFDAADVVIQMTDFMPSDVTAKAHGIAVEFPTARAVEGGASFRPPRERRPMGESLDSCGEHGRPRISAPDAKHLIFGASTIDLSDVDQLIEPAQTKAVGLAIAHVRDDLDGKQALGVVTERLMAAIRAEGLDVLDEHRTGDLAAFRPQDFEAVLNRMRDLKVY